jgi:hypothetical protein
MASRFQTPTSAALPHAEGESSRDAVGLLNVKLFSIALVALFVLCTAPYLTPIPTPFDLQPYALLMAYVCLLPALSRLPLTASDALLFLPFALGLVLVTVADDKFSALRSAFGYSSILIFSLIIRAFPARQLLRILDRVVSVMVWAWLLGAIAQLAYGKDVLEVLLPDLRTTGPRGFTSLAPEPYYYGITMFLILMYLVLRRKERSWLSVLCLFQIVFFAQSALVVLMTAGTLLVYALVHTGRLLAIRTLSAIALLCAAALTANYLNGGSGLFSMLEDSRLARVAALAIEEPAALVLVDQSGSERAAHMYFSIKGAFDNGLFPRGYDAWQTYFTDEIASHRSVFHYGDAGARIASGFGGALFELGVVGLAYPLYLALVLSRSMRTLTLRTVIVLAVGLTGALLGAVPLASPLVGILLGVLHTASNPVNSIANATTANR